MTDDITPEERARLLTAIIESPTTAPADAFAALFGRYEPDGSMLTTIDELEPDIAPADQFAELLTGVPHLDGRPITEDTVGAHLANYVDTIPADGGDDDGLGPVEQASAATE